MKCYAPLMFMKVLVSLTFTFPNYSSWLHQIHFHLQSTSVYIPSFLRTLGQPWQNDTLWPVQRWRRQENWQRNPDLDHQSSATSQSTKSTHVSNLVWDITKWIHNIDIKSKMPSYYPPNFDSVMTEHKINMTNTNRMVQFWSHIL